MVESKSKFDPKDFLKREIDTSTNQIEKYLSPDTTPHEREIFRAEGREGLRTAIDVLAIKRQFEDAAFENLLRAHSDFYQACRLAGIEPKVAASMTLVELVDRSQNRASPERNFNKPLRRVKAHLTAQYRSKNDPAETWSGRGSLPRWLKAEMAEYGSSNKEDWAIPETT